jgi:voltage-gated potassium channel
VALKVLWGGADPAHEPWRRVVLAAMLLVAVLTVGTVGYALLGLSLLDSLYQSVTTVTTVGFREVGEPTIAFRVFTILLVLLGAGTVLYTLGVLLETLVEGRLSDQWGRRRMQRELDALAGHVIVCGWGRVGRAIATNLSGRPVVVIDRDAERVASVPGLWVAGDATDDEVLRAAGIDRASALVAALSADADNLYVTLSARQLRPDLFIVARARMESAEAKLLQAGADRVVNPQSIGGARMAALVGQPHVAAFLDLVMHDGSLEFRLAEVDVGAGSPVVGQSLRDAHLRDISGALVLAMRAADGSFRANPPPDEVMAAGDVLIAIGTEIQLKALQELVTAR